MGPYHIFLDYNKFVASKDTYSGAVIPALQSSKTDIDYILDLFAFLDPTNYDI